MKRFLIILWLVPVLFLVACKDEAETVSDPVTPTETETAPVAETEPAAGTETGPASENTYQQITQDEAKQLMDTETGYVILDVREQYEYDMVHIPDAILLPYEQVNELAPEMLPDKDQMILVYCRTGRRSKIASQALADLGYTDVREFGGILDWTYEVVQ